MAAARACAPGRMSDRLMSLLHPRTLSPSTQESRLQLPAEWFRNPYSPWLRMPPMLVLCPCHIC